MKTLNKKIDRPYLPKGADVFYIGMDNKFLAEAKGLAKLSNEKQQPVGAVIVHNGEVISSAYNKNPLTNNYLINLHKKYCIRHILGIPTGKHYWMCPGCAGQSHHAEYKASKKLIKKGVPEKPVDLYIWGHWACCDACCSMMEKVPIDNIYFLENCEILFDPKEEGNIIGKQFD